MNAEREHEARPALTPELTAAAFTAWYWLKAELVAFCRTLGLSSAGSKQALQTRIEQHLLAQPSAAPRVRAANRKRSGAARSVANVTMPESFSPRTVIGHGWRCTTALRTFFVAELGRGFRFNAALRDFMHNGDGRTLADALDVYRISRNQPTSEIAPQFEYNRHMRAFFASHPTATREQARAAWWAARDRPRTPDKA